MKNIILNHLIEPKHILDDIELIPHPEAPRGQLAVFGEDDAGNSTGWWISQDEDDRRDNPGMPCLVGESFDAPDLEPVEILSLNYPGEVIVVEWFDLTAWGGEGDPEIHRHEFLDGDLLRTIVTMPDLDAIADQGEGDLSLNRWTVTTAPEVIEQLGQLYHIERVGENSVQFFTPRDPAAAMLRKLSIHFGESIVTSWVDPNSENERVLHGVFDCGDFEPFHV